MAAYVCELVQNAILSPALTPSLADKVLEGFAKQQGVWRYCVYFLQHSSNEHVHMYSLNILEVRRCPSPHNVTSGSFVTPLFVCSLCYSNVNNRIRRSIYTLISIIPGTYRKPGYKPYTFYRSKLSSQTCIP